MAVTSKRPRLNGVVNRIKLIGIELEGGWDKCPAGEEIQKDGSVKFPGTPLAAVPIPDILSDRQIREAHEAGQISTNSARRMLDENLMWAQQASAPPLSGRPAYKG